MNKSYTTTTRPIRRYPVVLDFTEYQHIAGIESILAAVLHHRSYTISTENNTYLVHFTIEAYSEKEAQYLAESFIYLVFLNI